MRGFTFLVLCALTTLSAIKTQVQAGGNSYDYDKCTKNSDCYAGAECPKHPCITADDTKHGVCACRKQNSELGKLTTSSSCTATTSGTCNTVCNIYTVKGYLCKQGAKTRCVCAK